MAFSITNCLLEWGLDIVFSITVDNASSKDVTVIEMSKQLNNWGTNIMEGQHLHVRCMTHILNLIVQDGLKEIDKYVKRVRQVVKYVKQYAARVKKSKECCEFQMITCKKSLCLDVPTRWNSTYLMLETAQHFELAFERFSFYDNGFLDYLHTAPFSGSKYVTNSVHLVEIAELDMILKEMIENKDFHLKKMTTNMREKFRKYWGDPKNMNKMIFISSVLDPRNKLEYVPFGIVDMFEKDIGDKLSDSVEAYMKALFEHYVKKSKNFSSTSHSENSSSVSGYGNFQRREIMRTKQQFEKHKEISGGSSSKSELEKYLAEEIEPDSENFVILGWWKVNEPRFPILAEMARDVLAISISSVSSECAFSTGGRVIDSFRSSLNPKLVQSLICLQYWLRLEPIPINAEEDLEYLEQLEIEMTCSGAESSIVDV
ncbi:hypothetical protein P3L10_007988 [Capsicum annuum]